MLGQIFLNLIDMCIGVYGACGRVMGLGFSGSSFLTKSVAMLFFVWLGVQKLGMDYTIFVGLICFFWFFTHIVEGVRHKHYIQKNVPKQLKEMGSE